MPKAFEDLVAKLKGKKSTDQAYALGTYIWEKKHGTTPKGNHIPKKGKGGKKK